MVSSVKSLESLQEMSLWHDFLRFILFLLPREVTPCGLLSAVFLLSVHIAPPRDICDSAGGCSLDVCPESKGTEALVPETKAGLRGWEGAFQSILA